MSVSKSRLIMLAVFSILLMGSAEALAKVKVVTTIEPLAYLIEKVGADNVEVNVMIPPGGNPHTYEPRPSQMVKLSKADLYFKVGTPFEFEYEWVPRLAKLNKRMKVINVSEGIRFIAALEHGGPGHEGCSITEADPHTWVSINNAMIMTRTIADTLAANDPDHASLYNANAEQLIGELGDLNYEIRQMLKSLPTKAFYIYHPAWGYFADDYGLEQVVIENEGKEPSARDLQRIIKEAKAKGIKAIFVAPEFSDRSAKVITHEIGGNVFAIDHLGKDFMMNMRKAAQAMAQQ